VFRIDECAAVRRKPPERSVAQPRSLRPPPQPIVIAEAALLGHLRRASCDFQDFALRRLGRRNPFGDERVRWRGSSGDDVLSAKAERRRANAQPRAAFASDAHPLGRIPVPTLSVHAVEYPAGFGEIESQPRDAMIAAGGGDRPAQTFIAGREQGHPSDQHCVAATRSLPGWVERGEMPDAARRSHRVDAGSTRSSGPPRAAASCGNARRARCRQGYRRDREGLAPARDVSCAVQSCAGTSKCRGGWPAGNTLMRQCGRASTALRPSSSVKSPRTPCDIQTGSASCS
jgi:hypothetical protein